MAVSAPPTLRILCFGASITAGFHMFGLAYHPYSQKLKSSLQQSFPQTELDLTVDAISGDVVLGGHYIRRLEAQCAPNTAKFDWMIFQGGGNDLGQGKQPQEVFEGLKKIWRMALDSGANVLALTVTETSSPSTQVRHQYDRLNQMILDHREEGYYVADLCTAIPYYDMDPERRTRIWDDGLHFKREGYDLMGETIAGRLKEISTMGVLSKF